jgi:hypothetical protein
MNPFVNPKKRGVTLPKDCKDLADVLKRSEGKHDDAIRRFIHLVLFQSQQDRATELVVGIATPSGVPIRYKLEGMWYEMSPFPSHIRADVVSELLRMAGFHAGQVPGEGVLNASFGDIRLRWMVAMTSADGECKIRRVDDFDPV